MHELSIAGAVVDTAIKHAAGRRVTLVTLRAGALRQVVPDSLEFYFGFVDARHGVRGRAAGAGGRARAAALLRARVGDRRPGLPLRRRAAAPRRWSAGNELEVESIEVEEAACTA